jgi:hypothetical protein
MRWKIACINWGQRADAPRFLSYLSWPTEYGPEAKLTAYHYTHAEAIARVDRLSPIVSEHVAKGGALRG